jgi:hypothetical protein
VLFFGALISGLFNGTTTVATSVAIVDYIDPRHHGPAFGLRMAAAPSGVTIASLGAVFVAHDLLRWQHIYWGAACTALICALCLRKPAKNTNGKSRRKQTHGIPGNRKSLRLLSIGALIGSTATAAVTTFLFASLDAHGKASGSAAALLATAGWLGILSRIVVGALADSVPRPLLHLRLSSALLAVTGVCMVGLVYDIAPILIIATFVPVCRDRHPHRPRLESRRSSPGRQLRRRSPRPCRVRAPRCALLVLHGVVVLCRPEFRRGWSHDDRYASNSAHNTEQWVVGHGCPFTNVHGTGTSHLRFPRFSGDLSTWLR